MDYNLFANLQYCKGIVDGLLSFILYSHIPSAVIALIVSGYILYKTRTLAGRVLIALAVVFSLWVGLDLSIWLGYGQASTLMAAWSVLGLLTAAMFILVFYFVYVLVFEKNMPNWMFVVWFIILMPVLFFTSTNFNLTGFDIRDCVAVENTMFTNYYYGIGVLVFLILPFVGYIGWKRASISNRTGIPMAVMGAELFLLSFFTTGVISQYLVENNIISDFGLEQYGIIAMAVFMIFLAYVIVKYQEFKIKLIATQALVVAIVILIATGFTFIQSTTGYVLVGVTLVLTVVTGFLLVRSVKREIAQREHIEKLAEELQATNTRQETLMHFIGHEVKGFLTKDAGAFAALLDGDFGQCDVNMKPFVEVALAQSRDGARSVTDILTASNQKKGTMTYAKEPFDLKTAIEETVAKEQTMAKEKNLTITFSADDSGMPYTFNGDKAKISDNVFRNIIENSIHYTPSGSITANLKKDGGKFVFTIKDTGVGISSEDMKRLFTEGGHGENSQKVNVHSTGYGLFIAKNVVEGHGGTIRAESDGEGKGSTFIVELPS